MAKSGWEEFNEVTTRLEALEQKLAVSGNDAALSDEIRKVSARREMLLTALWETTDMVVKKGSSWTDSPAETAPARRYSREAGEPLQRRTASVDDARRRRLGRSY